MAKKPHNQAKKPSNSGKLGKNGRKANGRFKKGNRHSVGNPGPSGSKAQKLKDAALAAVSAADIKFIIKKLVSQARAGDIKAAKEVFDRCLGKPKEISDVNVNPPQPIDRPILTIEDVKKRIAEYEAAGDGIDWRSINGGGTVHKMG